jgi:probable HAF family extracellular repeat protein
LRLEVEANRKGGRTRACFNAKTKRRFDMKTILFRTSLVGLLAASPFYAQSSINTRASSNPGAAAQAPTRYSVDDLGKFTTFSTAFSINSAGRVGGTAALPTGNTYPILWPEKTNLGTLGGPNGQASAPNGRGEATVLSQTSTPDPLNEDFCGFDNHLTCLGARWNGVLTPLPTLGGNNAMALALNNRGQVIGVAETGVADASCASAMPFQALRYEAVVWGPNPGEKQELPPLSGDTVGFALGINDRGQVVGSSGSCANTVVTAVGLFVGQHAVLWENGSPKHLGTLGGSMGKAGAINDRGEVAGFSSLPGDSSVHSVLWTEDGVVHDLGALGTDFLGDPAGINNNAEVVGGSCDNTGNCRAFFWQKGAMSDLNDLIPADSPLYLVYALGINDAGEIVGFGVEKSTGELHAYLASPIRGKSGQPVALDRTSENRRVALPENVRLLLQQRLPFGRLGGR